MNDWIPSYYILQSVFKHRRGSLPDCDLSGYLEHEQRLGDAVLCAARGTLAKGMAFSCPVDWASSLPLPHTLSDFLFSPLPGFLLLCNLKQPLQFQVKLAKFNCV